MWNISDLSKSRLGNKGSKVGRVSGMHFQMTTDVFHLLPPVTFIITECNDNCNENLHHYVNYFPTTNTFKVSFNRKWRLYSSCVQSSMLHGSETWLVRKENEVALQRAEMRMVRWMCNVKVKDRVPSKELKERLGIDDIILILQQNRFQWYGHMLRKEDSDWVKKCMEYEVEGSRARGRPKRTWKKVVQKRWPST